tara:strand:- start:658 stop:1677 length:1020 start_codon:yes stop_codon:yes gene_type:complete
MSSGSGSDSGSSSSDRSTADVESGLATESIMDYSVAEGGAGGDQEAYNEIMESAAASRESDAAALTRETQNLKDYETQAYQNVSAVAVPTFEQGTGKFTGVETRGEGVVSGQEYNTANIKGYLLDSTISDKAKVDMLNQLQGIANSKYDSGKPNVDREAKAYIQENLETTLDNIKEDAFYNQYTDKIDADAATYVDTFRDQPLQTFAKSGFSLTGLVVRSAKDAYKNDQALKTLGYDGRRLSPNYAETGGILTTEDYLKGQTLDSDAINQAIPVLPGLISGEALPTSVFQTFFGNVGQAGSDILNRYDTAKQNINLTVSAPNVSPSYGIFSEARKQGLI